MLCRSGIVLLARAGVLFWASFVVCSPSFFPETFGQGCHLEGCELNRLDMFPLVEGVLWRAA